MTTYKALHGKKVKYLSSDPPASVGEGQVWYNSAETEYKTSVLVAAWTSGGNMGTARGTMGCAGTQTAALSGGGGNPGKISFTEEYDGSSWSEQNDLNTTRSYTAGFGIQTAAVVVGGFVPPAQATSEEYDGTSYTEGNDLGTARYALSASGTLTAGLVFGGTDSGFVAHTEEYDGTSYSEQNNLSATKAYMSGFGTQTASLAISGQLSDNSVPVNVELYDGTSWTETANLNTSRGAIAGAGGTTASGMVFGGLANAVGGAGAPASALVEAWDGTSWTETSNLATARFVIGGSGTSATSMLAFGGRTAPPVPSFTTATEEFSEAGVIKTISDS